MPPKRTFKKRTFSKKKKYTNSVATQALRLAKKVARQVNVEYKHHETDLTGLTAPDNGVILRLDSVPTGNTDASRSGISIKPMRISGKLHIIMDTATPMAACRLILFRGKAEKAQSYTPQGNTPLAILDPDIQGYLARKNRNNRFDTKFIYDKVYTMSNTGKNNILVDWNFKLFGHINYVDSATNDIDNGGLYIMVFGDENPVVVGQLTLTYTDN